MRRAGAIAMVAGLCAAASAASSAAREVVLPLRVDGAGLERFAAAVSDPSSPSYGRYASIETLARRFGASRAARRRVVSYLRRHDATGVKIDTTGLFADATVGARVSTRALDRALRGAVTGVLAVGAGPAVFHGGRPSLTRRDPFGLAVGAQTRSARKRTGTPAGCPEAIASGGFAPNQYLSAFGYSALQAAGDDGQGERVALLEADGIDMPAVAAFAQCFALSVPPVTTHLVGLSRALRPGPETTLDLEVLTAAAPQLSAIDVYEAGHNDAEFLKTLAAPLHNRAERPEVISISLGDCEANIEKLVSEPGFRQAELALAEDAAAGISVVAATGDTGSTGCQQSSNLLPDDVRAVVFPASSPHVLAIGGTNITLTPDNALTSEIVWNEAPRTAGAGGGGCSVLFARPMYQAGLRGCVTNERRHGRTVKVPTRAMPDLSMLADGSPGYAIFCPERLCGSSNPWQEVGGTSAAAPLLAGGLALVDQSLRATDRKPLGAAGPLMYEVAKAPGPRAFHDVTRGNNDIAPFLPGARHRGVGCCSAHSGYDLATGLGSIDLARFAQIVAIVRSVS